MEQKYTPLAGISYLRMMEIATKAMDLLIEIDYEAVTELCSELDMTGEECVFFDIFPGMEDEDYDDYSEPDDSDGSELSCKDCPDSECTGHCMSCMYRPF